MTHWLRQHMAWVLFISLVVLLVANIWLFVPRFLIQQQKLTQAELTTQSETLSRIASAGSDLTRQLSSHELTPQHTQKLTDLQQQADDVVVHLQHAPYEVALDSEVKQYLELAQIIAFTLRDVNFKITDQLQMNRISQVLSQAVISADSLPHK